MKVRMVALFKLLGGGVMGTVGRKKCMLEFGAENKEEAHSKYSNLDGSTRVNPKYSGLVPPSIEQLR
jgi:hypothetical protein